MHDERLTRLIVETVTRRYSRRDVLQRAAALGLAVPAIGLALRASDAIAQIADAPGATNPLGVDPSLPLDVFVCKCGNGDAYTAHPGDLYKELYPGAKVSFTSTTRLGEQLQPRFVNGSPPDVINNSGAGNLDMIALIAEDQLAPLDDLMAAPSLDTEGKTFAETLIAGTQDQGVFDGKQLSLKFTLAVYGIWYSKPWMEARGYTYPTTWAEMIDLSQEIKDSGIYPWVTTGVYPQYIKDYVFDQMVWKQDPQAQVNIDNLEADAWRQPAVQNALEAMYQLAERDLILPGWEAETHTESQAEWLQGNAIFVPCGSWLKREMGDLVPEGFDMVVQPVPSLEGDKIPFEGIFSGPSADFFVPANAANVQGGKEWLRILFSKEGGRFFAEDTGSLSVVAGSAEGLDLGTAFSSTQAALENAGEYTSTARYLTWYPDLEEMAKNQLAALLQRQITIEEFMDTVQEVADDIKDDDMIIKYHREL